MDREKIGVVLAEAKRLTHHTDYVIMGNLWILGSTAVPPPRMATSIDVDCYPPLDPGRADEISRAIGQGSDFEKEHGFYADALRPTIAALPDGWESRLVQLEFPDGIRGALPRTQRRCSGQACALRGARQALRARRAVCRNP